MVVFPPCKINLGLHILRKRNDGYHDLESVFHQIPLFDVLEALPKTKTGAEGMQLHLTGLEIPGKENILEKIYHTLSKIRILPPLNVYLHKVIPFGAGLGGGSSDAAYLIRLLNKMCKLQLSHEEMHHTALQAGSDCPFFLSDNACYVEGRGEIVHPIDFSLKGKHIMLVFPGIHISTAEAYAQVKPEEKNISIPQVLQQPIKTWKHSLFNDFEASLFPKYPALEQIKKTLYQAGAAYASMSGSGSTLFGIFENPPPDLTGDYQTYSAVL